MTLFALVALLVLSSLSVAIAQAQDGSSNRDAQGQVDAALAAIRDSHAESAAGSYVPGSGAFFAISFIHGPNTEVVDAPYRGVRDWGIYAMTTFGPTLTAVPDDETIAFTIRYFDYVDGTFHSITISAPARGAADANAFTIWLDGDPYDEDVARQTEADNGGDVPTPIPTSSTVLIFESPMTPTPTPAEASPTAPASTPIVAASPSPLTLPEGPLTFDEAGALAQWSPVGGTWVWSDGTYEQQELNRFDLISYFVVPVTQLGRLAIDMRFVEGQMGAGVVFAASQLETKNGAHMVSFAADGTFLQWGYFDNAGVFQYQGGVSIGEPPTDGSWYPLEVTITGQTYTVAFNGVTVGSDIPLLDGAGGYVGLLSSTSRTQFDNVVIEEAP